MVVAGIVVAVFVVVAAGIVVAILIVVAAVVPTEAVVIGITVVTAAAAVVVGVFVVTPVVAAAPVLLVVAIATHPDGLLAYPLRHANEQELLKYPCEVNTPPFRVWSQFAHIPALMWAVSSPQSFLHWPIGHVSQTAIGQLSVNVPLPEK